MAKVTWEMSGEEAVGSSRTAFIKKIYELAEKDQSIVLVNCDCSPEAVCRISLVNPLVIGF